MSAITENSAQVKGTSINRHREERSDVAIQKCLFNQKRWIAALRSQ
jgi:hypothetical protein